MAADLLGKIATSPLFGFKNILINEDLQFITYLKIDVKQKIQLFKRVLFSRTLEEVIPKNIVKFGLNVFSYNIFLTPSVEEDSI